MIFEQSRTSTNQILESQIQTDELEKKVKIALSLICPGILREFFANCVGRCRQMVMGDSGEEEMMGDVAISDVVEESVNAEPVFPVDGLHLTLDIVPVGRLVHLDIVVLMLQIGDHHQPVPLEQQWHVVVLDEGEHAVVAQMERRLQQDNEFDQF
jgi:hypothetical protein